MRFRHPGIQAGSEQYDLPDTGGHSGGSRVVEPADPYRNEGIFATPADSLASRLNV
jgi:hypothetical protein